MEGALSPTAVTTSPPREFHTLLSDSGQRGTVKCLESAVALLMPVLQFDGRVPAALVPPGSAQASWQPWGCSFRCCDGFGAHALTQPHNHQLPPPGFARHRAVQFAAN